MIESVIIQSSDSGANLTFSEPEIGYDLKLEYALVTLFDEGLNASTRIYFYRFEPFIELFESMASEWKGWEGEKCAESIEGDLNIICKSDKLGHAFVEVRLRPYMNNWRAQTMIRIDSSQYEVIAQELRGFFFR